MLRESAWGASKGAFGHSLGSIKQKRERYGNHRSVSDLAFTLIRVAMAMTPRLLLFLRLLHAAQ
jgi:hypothetical protein